MKVEISNGELLDKLSILSIKSQRINDESKLHNIRREHAILETLSESLLANNQILENYLLLMQINTKLWDIENAIRLKELSKIFDTEFIELARSVYITNDRRAEIKRNINELSGSELIEEKSYSTYN